MKSILFVLVAILIQAAPAQAERWIVKNPSSAQLTMNAIKSFQFGNDTYVVVEGPQFSALMSDVRNFSESATPAVKITLPATGEEEINSESKAWHVRDMRYAELPSTADGSNIVVAVLDTGVDYTHPNLKDQIWVNQREIAGNGLDDDGNGYIDDVNGWDFEQDDADPMDDNSHGTHCAGIIAGTVDTNTGAQGVAPGARVMPVRIIGTQRMGFISDAVAGIKYAVDNGAKVLSNSWRVYRSWSAFDPSDENIELLRRAIDYARQNGAIFVAAAGNESKNLDTGFERDPMYPGGYTGIDTLVVVAASNEKSEMAYFSNYGARYVTVAAPGNNIISTVPGKRFSSMSGTSMATPLVAGAIARGLSTSMTANITVEKLVNTSSRLDSWTDRVRAGGVIQLVDYLK